MDDLTKRVYQAFDPAPLTSDVDSLYVELDDVRGSSCLVKSLADKIHLSNTLTCQLMTGHRGSGKTTELRKLQNELETAQEKYFVVFCEIDKDVDRNDIDFPDVLIAIVRQMAVQLKEREKIELKPGYFQQRWDGLKKLLTSEVTFEKVDLATGLLNLSVAIKSSPDTRMEIRKYLEPNTNSWIEAANDVMGEAVIELRKKDYVGLVIIVDDLDKMVMRPLPAAGCSTGEHFFINREAQLSSFACHLVYTMPIALAYSCKEQVIASLYNTSIPIVPMTKIKTREGARYDVGFDKFKELIDKRLGKAGAGKEDVFEEGVCDQLIELSGGQPRELMNLIRNSIIGGDLPISTSEITRTIRQIEHAYTRQLQKKHWEIIKQVKKDHRIDRTEKKDKYWMELLDSRAVLLYVNDEEWYAVNPLVPEQKA